jgi:hypothetical protein
MGPIFVVQAVTEDCLNDEDGTDRCVTSQKSEDLISIFFHMFIHLAVCLTTGSKPLPKPALHIVRSRAFSFRCEYPLLFLRLSCSFLRLLSRLLVTCIPPFIFALITCYRRQFLLKMWPIQLAFRLLISCRIFLCSLTLSNTSPFLSWSVQLVFSIYYTTSHGQGISVGTAGRSGDRIPVRARFFAHVQTGPGPHPASRKMGTGSLLGVKRPGRVADHPPFLAPRLRMCRANLYSPSRPLVACYRVIFTFVPPHNKLVINDGRKWHYEQFNSQ